MENNKGERIQMDLTGNAFTPNTILVVGNGFDLHCEIKSRFSDYYSKVCLSTVQAFYLAYKREDYEDALTRLQSNPKTINFWSFLLFVHYYGEDEEYKIKGIKDSNWFDIENLIRVSLTEPIQNGFGLEQYINESIKALQTKRSVRDQYLGNVRRNPYIFFPFLQKAAISNPIDYLLQELHKFEDSFKEYMKGQIDSEYPLRCHNALVKMIGEDSDFIDIINFNYTEIVDEIFVNNQTNVHGRIDEEEIIIGIDSDGAPDKISVFTKTFRNLHRSKTSFKLPANIEDIVFYGHSLADADFSYFYSLFDMYNLYGGQLKLRFLYSDYCASESENERNHTNYVNHVYRLINKYSARSHNETNLLHRLLLEGRVFVKRI